MRTRFHAFTVTRARFPRAAGLAFCVATLATLAGCVERKMIIRTDPVGAILRLDGVDIESPTPVEFPSQFDGTHHVEISANGYRSVTTTAMVPAHWFDYFPLDVFAEFLYPGTLRVTDTFDYRLEAYQPMTQKVTDDQLAALRTDIVELRARAEEYRSGGVAGPALVGAGGANAGASDGGSVAAPRGPDFVSGKSEFVEPATKSRDEGLRPLTPAVKPGKPGDGGK